MTALKSFLPASNSCLNRRVADLNRCVVVVDAAIADASPRLSRINNELEQDQRNLLSMFEFLRPSS
jgi:hypothetical protein